MGTQIEGACILDVWTTDGAGSHLSKIGNGTLQIGLEVTAITDCEEGFNVSIDGEELGFLQGGGFLFFTVSTSTHTMEFQNPNGTTSFQNLTFYPADMMGQAIDFYEFQEIQDGDYWTAQSLRSHEFFVALVTVFSSLLFSLFVVERVSGFLHSRSIGKEITGVD
ncbi:MAG TPA: hypothetical protein EYN67_16680 [Flavobacteriales bacterium]|nr:hypothetical protein [Flavobacteriales bacterium]